MNLIPASKARKHFSQEGETMDLRTFRDVAKQWKLKPYPVGKRIKYNEDEIKNKLKVARA